MPLALLRPLNEDFTDATFRNATVKISMELKKEKYSIVFKDVYIIYYIHIYVYINLKNIYC